MCSKWDNDEVIERFREYVRIPSVHPDIDYDDCVKFLKKQANDLDLPVIVYELVPKKPVVVITWEGVQPELPSILLNSHMDVVPVYEEHWTYPPFDAVVTEDGYIYGRGTLDMKGIGMMHLEAVRRLKTAGVRLKRTVLVSFVPDEETGSVDGMRVFSESPEFKKLNIGFALDESGPSLSSTEILAFYGERTSRQIVVTCRGDPGHGSLLSSDTAGEKLHYIINKFMTLRAEEKSKVDSGTWVGDITTINLTQLSGGVQINVLPENLTVSFDIRIAPDVDHDEFDDMISKWCKEAGDGVTFEYVVKNPQVKNTKIDGSVPFWDVMKNVVVDMGYTIKCVICPGATDARHVRRQGIPAINFSPILETPMLLHAHNERIHVDMYKKGIDIFENVLVAIANVP
ncbi:aminoacylase-1-like [Spodoptera litura]|uniref:N-acyl-aliphatic-L-amino acid amidohydrolase n=1 Tax=Spodoptera litura TaxID=69820 RepID=A0A9J7DQE1_SPOLT|nr:aminoacylase-1-like [Spodoptera litura]